MRAKALSFHFVLGTLLLIALVLRVAYVVAQPAFDPAATGAELDGAYYVNWGRALAEGAPGPSGAYYLAPLYAWLLAGFFTVFGESIAWLYLLQQVTVVGTALLLALSARRLAGNGAGWAAATLLLLYHPAFFFASRPLGEPVSIFLLVLALWLFLQPPPHAWGGAGLAAALSALGRPNVLLVLAVWFVLGLFAVLWSRRGEPREGRGIRIGVALALAGAAIVLAPVAIRNWSASGHLVPVSSNAGITAWHGNAPGAWGIAVATPDLGDSLAGQREDATRVASLRAGRPLDDVEADRWWGRQALRVRAADPSGTLALLVRRAGLLVANAELGLDYAPSIDRNPWRHTGPLPYALLLALALTGLVVAGFPRSGGWVVWGAVLACAATPLLFYVSSRYRLPMAVLLVLPAGVGLAEICRARGKRLFSGLAVLLAVVLLSLGLPSAREEHTTEAGALANRAVSWKRLGDLARAEEDLRQALATDPECVAAHFGLGKVLEDRGEATAAERQYRRALELRPSSAESAHNLSGLLVRNGRPREAVPILLRTLEFRPHDVGCWKNLVVAHYASGEFAQARAAAARAARFGVALEAAWLDEIERSVGVSVRGLSPVPDRIQEVDPR